MHFQLKQPIALNTHRQSATVWGGGSIHSQGSASDLGRGLCLWGCEVGEAIPVSGKGNKGPLCPVEVGLRCHGHQQVHRQEHARVG